MLRRCEYCVSLREGKSSGGHPHDDRAAVWHVLAIDDLESGEEGPDSPVGEPSNNPMGDVGFGHVDDGTRQGAGDLSEGLRQLYPKQSASDHVVCLNL